MDPFAGFPDDARLWVFALTRPLHGTQHDTVTRALDDFTSNWKSHGSPVRGAWQLVDDRIILIAGYVGDGVSGCSTDSMVRVLKTLREHHGIDGFDRTLVFFRTPEARLDALSRDDFAKKVAEGTVNAETIVLDATIQTVGDLRAGRLESRFADSWHSRAFAL